ncbi:MAG: ATP-binding protein, partial [Alphaproteobacteria bacterium]|nr:ATP-binding protein [Alphaproteobacteria bacterium]
MKISQIRIANFRSIKDMTIDAHSYTSILGSNGAGKSNVLRALNVFFGEIDAKEIGEDDWFNRDVSKPIEIELTFEGLSVVEQKKFEHYFRDGKLTFMVEINDERQRRYVGWRMVLADF